MENTPKKIHIIGSTGSGKTYLAKKCSERWNIPYFELDQVVWSGTVEMAGKNPPEVRERLLSDIIKQETWIVEGVYYKWLSESFQSADMIIFLTTHLYVRDMRIIARFIKQRTGIEKSNYKQTLKGLIEMIKWNHKFERIIKQQILDFLQPYSNKLIILKNNNQFEEYFREIK